MTEPRKLPAMQFVAVIPPGYQGIASAPVGLVITGVAKPALVWDGAKWVYLKAVQQSLHPAPGNIGR